MAHPTLELKTDNVPSGPWIYARNVPDQRSLADGALVEVIDRSGRFVGHGLYNGASDIRVRFLSRGRRHELDRPADFLLRRLRSADRLRRRALRLPKVTDAWRLAHAEGDDLPGLIVDRLAGTYVCEHHALGFWRLRDEVERALLELEPGARVVHRVPRSARSTEGFEPEEETADVGEVTIHEHGIEYPVHPGHGHKTGWFCDQRDNRRRVAEFAADRDVLDLCCNAGGFALSAARAGARRVRGVDLDEVALDRADRAARANGLAVELLHEDAFDTLRRVRGGGPRPDLVIVDPHKLILNRRRLEEGKRRYLDLNALAIEATAPGGLLATFSCSGALDLAGFLGIVFQGARRADREIRVLEIFGAAPDHPQRPEFARSRYLKGALVAVD